MPKYRVLMASDDVIPVANLMVCDEEGRISHLMVKHMPAENAKTLIGETIHVHTTNREIVPRDITVKAYELEPLMPLSDEEDIE